MLDEPGVRRIAVGDGRVVSANLIDGREVLVLAEEEGQSSAASLEAHRSQLFDHRRVGGRGPHADRSACADRRGRQRAALRIVGDKIVLEGNDVNREQARRIDEVGKRYPQVVN